MEELPRAVANTQIGKESEIVVLRDGKEKTFKVRVGELKEASIAQPAKGEGAGPDAFGLRVKNLTPEIAEQLDIDEAKGVVVVAVEPGSPAEESGIRRGDVIIEVDRAPVGDVAELQSKLGDVKKGALLLVRRGDSTVFVPLRKKS
jgi:serine protease Do